VGPLHGRGNGNGNDALVANLIQFCLNAIREATKKENADVGARSHA